MGKQGCAMLCKHVGQAIQIKKGHRFVCEKKTPVMQPEMPRCRLFRPNVDANETRHCEKLHSFDKS